MILSWEPSLSWALQGNHMLLKCIQRNFVLAQQLQCYHQMAVKLSIGMSIGKEKKKVNWPQLRCNTRSNSQNKSGRKRPRPGTFTHEPFI